MFIVSWLLIIVQRVSNTLFNPFKLVKHLNDLEDALLDTVSRIEKFLIAPNLYKSV